MLEGLTEVWGNSHSIHEGYESARFRPVEHQKIDVFKEMLEPAKIKREPEPVK